jgi:SAM-dependent methyltransferase
MAHRACVALRERWYVERGWRHASRHYEDAVAARLDAGKSILDLGCGRTFPLAAKYLARTDTVYGVDPLAEPTAVASGAIARVGSADAIPFPDASFDVVACRSVLEHIRRPAAAFAEVARVLRPGGVFIFLTPSRYDYVSLAAGLLPNAWHPWIVQRLEGRAEADTFPTFYRANSRSAVECHARRAGLVVGHLEYLRHHPEYFMSSPLLYRLAALYDDVIGRLDVLDFLRGWLLGVLQRPYRRG